eukprot:6156172-Pyramimonas_sp.AAC.1
MSRTPILGHRPLDSGSRARRPGRLSWCMVFSSCFSCPQRRAPRGDHRGVGLASRCEGRAPKGHCCEPGP